MPSPPKCSRCGASLAADVPGSHCLRCLLGLGLRREEEPAEEGAAAAVSADTFPGYRILEQLGEGGCGVVYRAAQTEPVRREVAIKVIKLGMDTRAVITRFEAERQALALMNHPHIARVFDAGTTGRGHPFFVMELVAGENITAYCDRHQLDIHQRLGIFLHVCDAVRHAHLKGIIHRDLKPSNILVADIDGRPVPKVIDFGVAKAMDHQRLAGQTIYTAFDQFVGTPAYMSPEQAGLTGEDIDARSDIYSLGVLLYELLTGRPPFEPERLHRAAIQEVCRIIREEDPALPSSRLSSLGAAGLTATAGRRLLSPRRLAGELRGDLDGIVMKALEKSRDRRYDTANELAADILRHLRHEPVTARAPGTLYRFRKFARRNKLAIGTAAAVLATLLGGLAVSSWSYLRERRARERLEQRAYQADMNSAARMTSLSVGGLGGTVRLLDEWQDRRPDRRGWEWYYLHGLCHHELLSIRADATELWSVTWSPDGTRLATGGAEGTVKIWEAATGRALATWSGHAGPARVVTWSPDGRWIASAGREETVRIWAADQGGSRDLATAATTLAWAPDGRRLASGSADGTVKIWDPVTAASARTLAAGSPVNAVCWDGGGTRLFATGSAGLNVAWDAATGRELWRAVVNGTVMLAAACSPDGREMVTGGMDNAINFRNARTGANLDSLFDNQNAVLSIAWSADGSRLATATRGDGRIAIRDARSGGRVVRDFRGHLGSVRTVAWRPDGTQLASASADGTVRIWNAGGKNPSGRLLHQPDQAKTLAWSPDGTKLAAVCRRMDAWIWDFNIGDAPIALPGGYTEWTNAVAWNPDGTRLVSGGSGGLRVWDPVALNPVWQDPTAVPRVSAVAWAPDGRRIAALGSNRQFAIWDAATGKPLQSLTLPTVAASSLAWHPDGSRIATAIGSDIHLWDARLKPLAILSGHREGAYGLAWSPDGKRLASGGGDTSAKIWDAGSGRILHNLLGHAAPVSGTAWSPDGTRLVTGSWDLSIKIWDPATGTEVCSFDKPAGIIQMIYSVAWSPDGRRIAVSDIEGHIGILDATPGGLAATGPKPPSPTPLGATAASATSRSLKLYCDTVEPHADQDPDALRRLAWIRATAPYPEVRDGPKAVRLAEEANRQVGGQNAGILSILAAAYAECGDFAKAIAIQKQAISLITSDERRSAFTAELRCYEAGQPCRDHSW